MRPLILAALIAFPLTAHAAEPAMVLLPRQLAEAAQSWIAQPDARTAVQIYGALAACIASNGPRAPQPDACGTVTAALRAQREAASKGAAHAPPPAPAMPSPPAHALPAPVTTTAP